MIHSFLMVGQSNMAGRGFPGEVEPIDTENIYVLRNGRWWPMYVPVNPDRVTAGISPAESFARRYADCHPGVQVGLIPCADGGTGLEQWLPGQVLYDHAVMTAKLAQRTSVIAGILWHQGEADCINGGYTEYLPRCSHILNSMRRDLGIPDVPVLVGGLGDFLARCRLNPKLSNYVHVNAALREMAQREHNMGFVSAEGLDANPDDLHFSAKAQREFGERYFEAFCKLSHVQTAPAGEDIHQATAMEAL